MSLDDLKQKMLTGMAELSDHAKDGMRQMADLARAECRRANAAELKVQKLQAKLDKETAQHTETRRQLAEIEARYTPLVTENDELREKLEMSVLDDLRECARSWEPEARLLGNVRACEIVELCDELAETRTKLEREAMAHAETVAARAESKVCTPAERAVLDAMARASRAEIEEWASLNCNDWIGNSARAELARRGEKP